MISRKFLIYNQDPIAPVALMNELPVDLSGRFVVPYTQDWHSNTELVFFLAQISNRKTETEFEVLKDIQLDRSIVNGGIHLELDPAEAASGFNLYATEALATLMQSLNTGRTTNRVGVQPHQNFEYNGAIYQWGIVPI
ncbi:hypothetical protein D3P96_08205 [Weissella viridescens]|uniref:Uncharacterized protein n=1 Tax=Weissella viridescens TaxID=1629 RepID=A0A3P2RA85_WEIVI|nr:hypothetical protein [Weissella viridescens]RRG17344.1 hypothetical protein D3P96_08205 [Weissella viridescens]